MTGTTFVVPTIGRDSLKHAVKSVLAQRDSAWRMILVFDGIEPTVDIVDPRLAMVRVTKRGRKIAGSPHSEAGAVRNVGLQMVQTEWASFLDDDDCVDPGYVEYLRAHVALGVDVVVFRMGYRGSVATLPPLGVSSIVENQIGISFSVRMQFLREHNVWFENHPKEDYRFLRSLKREGATFVFAPEVAYWVGGSPQEP